MYTENKKKFVSFTFWNQIKHNTFFCSKYRKYKIVDKILLKGSLAMGPSTQRLLCKIEYWNYPVITSVRSVENT
jgi:hypothetical protein